MVLTALLTLRRISDDYEVIVVNDGSRDHTAGLLSELADKYPPVRVVDHERNRGYGAALRTGIAQARKEFVFYTDGDAQYDVRELEKLVPLMTDDVDMVNGYKIGRSDPLYRAVLGTIYRIVTRAVFGIRLRDIDCDFRLMRRSIFDRIRLQSDSGTICVEMVKKIESAGFRIRETPVHHFHRSYGKSQYFTIRRLARTVIDLTRLWIDLFVRKPSEAPEPPSGIFERRDSSEQAVRRTNRV